MFIDFLEKNFQMNVWKEYFRNDDRTGFDYGLAKNIKVQELEIVYIAKTFYSFQVLS